MEQRILIVRGVSFDKKESKKIGGKWFLKKRGGNTEGAQKRDFGAIPYFLVIANYKNAFLYIALK